MTASFSPLAIRTLDDFNRLIKLYETPEGITLEFKRQGSWARTKGEKKRPAQKEACRDISQLANSEGGCLLIGVTDDGTSRAGGIEAVTDPDALHQWLEDAIHTFLEPRTFAHEICRIEIPGQGCIIAVNVAPCAEPIFLWDANDGTMACYRRDSHGKKPCNPKEVAMFTGNTSRAMRIRILQSCEKDTPIAIFGGILVQEFVPMGTGNNGSHIYERPYEPNVRVVKINDQEFSIGVHLDNEDHHLAVPYGFIEEIWEDAHGRVTISLIHDIIRDIDRGLVLRRTNR